MKFFRSLLERFGKLLRRRWKLLAILVVVLLVLGIFISKRQSGSKKVVKTEHPIYEDLVQTVDVSGVVDAKQKSSLRFAAGGKLTYLSASEGAEVKSGQVLARIDARTLQKQLQQDLNTYFNQRMDFEQGKEDRQDLAPTNTLGRDAQKDQKTLENQVLNVEIQSIAISNTILKSPLNGILVTAPSNTKGGDILATDTFQIVNPESLVLRVTVDQADISKIRKDQPVSFVLDAYPDQTFRGKVNYVSYTSSQASTGTVFVVEIPIPITNRNEALEKFRIGMNGDAKIEVDRAPHALTIPLSATKQRDDKTYVTLKVGDKTEEREIRPGLETIEKLQVKSGLSENDEVVVPE
jgi:RND family efflux transporter MFP subunit